MLASPDQQISLTDPDSRSMATSGRGSGVVGYNVQVSVDTEHYLIVTHEVTNDGSDRAQLANIACRAPLPIGATTAVRKSSPAGTRHNATMTIVTRRTDLSSMVFFPEAVT